jgi:DNA-binding transcriptional MocR family regulator
MRHANVLMNHQTETDMDYAIHHWSKRLLESRKPAYLLIPDLIEEDLATGRLKPRDRLPGLRDLAGALNLNYTTVARAVCDSPTRLARYAGRQRNVRARPDTDVPAIRREQRRDDDEHAP